MKEKVPFVYTYIIRYSSPGIKKAPGGWPEAWCMNQMFICAL